MSTTDSSKLTTLEQLESGLRAAKGYIDTQTEDLKSDDDVATDAEVTEMFDEVFA